MNELNLQLSCDGVSENRSTSTSLDVYTICFEKCNTIYPLKIVRPLRKFKLDPKLHLQEVLNDITINGFRIKQFIADNQKRALAKNCQNHASWFPCEYCFAKGIKIALAESTYIKNVKKQHKMIEDKIRNCENEPDSDEKKTKLENLGYLKEELKKCLDAVVNKKSNILWPSSTMNSEHRSRRSIEEIVERIENGEQLSKDEAKGVVGQSLLFDLPDFNFIYDVPAEYLHSGCLGVTKRLVQLTFKVGETRQRVTKRKLSSIDQFNRLMSEIKVLHEFSRIARELDFAVFKGQEFRNLALFFFPLVLECIDPGEKERHLWLNLAYMMRSAVIPSNEYWNISENVVRQCCLTFYELFEKLMGPHNCTYNLHVLCCHLLEIRTHGPLTETSAFKFESFYSELRRSFVPGTVSPTKQIMKNVLLKRIVSSHNCENNIFISNYDTDLECNSIVYTYVRNEYNIYKVNDINEDVMNCNRIGKYPATFEETPEIDWSTVGVFRKGGQCSEPIEVAHSEISGKVISVGKYLLTCPKNVLQEK